MEIAKALNPEQALRDAHPAALVGVKTFRDELTLVIDPAHIVTVAEFMRNTPGLLFNYLSDISAVDYYPEDTRPGRFGISYHIYSMLYNRRIRLKVFLQDEEPTVDTVTGVWSAANWLEREIYDMMGITFTGHPDLRRLLMPEDWDGHPHRRDYPLGYETVQFSFNAEDIMKHKPFAKE
ncbi:MAG: NADH-quinone oxidoreductase subunit C [Chloroflexi bacterium]|nr:MAG: NADH-quinone oxidoreductase subunit C [Chloroflexota bacterium]